MTDEYDTPGQANDPAESPVQYLERCKTEWLEKIGEAETELRPFFADVKTAIKCFGLDRQDGERSKRRFEIAWANREILQSAVYERAPKCVIKSRYNQGDPVARAASELMERAVNTNAELTGMHDSLLKVRDEFVDFSRGSVWLRYEPTFETEQVPVPPSVNLPDGMQSIGQDAQGNFIVEIENKVDEKVCLDFVGRDDFRHGKALEWKNVPWAARRSFMTKQKITDRFGKEIAALVSFSADEETKGQPKNTVAVWECWCKESNKVYFVSQSCSRALEVTDPFLNLSGFFPCPPPAFGTLRDKKLVPIPDVMFYESQIKEINQLTARIHAISDALKVRGFYPAGASRDGSDAIEEAIKTNDDRQVLIPVPGWAAMAGSKDLGIVWLPVDVVAKVLTECVNLRRQLIDDVYQITGISDILRGDSEASETLGAQEIKAQWGGKRIRRRQKEMERLARDSLRIMAEIMAENFSPETLVKMTQMKFAQPQAMGTPPNAPMAQGPQPAVSMQQSPQMPGQPAQVPIEQVIALLRDDTMRGFSIDVETDSTVAADEGQEQKSRVEFGAMLGQTLTTAAPIIQQAPELANLVGETIKFIARGFRVGRELEQTIDDAMQALVQRASQPQPQADPNAGAVETAKIKGQVDLAKTDKQEQTKRLGLAMEHQRAGEQAAIEASATPEPGADTEGGEQTQEQAQPKPDAMMLLTQQVAALVQLMASPKRIIHDSAGRPVGVEPVTMQ